MPLPAARVPSPVRETGRAPLNPERPSPRCAVIIRHTGRALTLDRCLSNSVVMQSAQMKTEPLLLETRSSLIQRLKVTINGESWQEFFQTYW